MESKLETCPFCGADWNRCASPPAPAEGVGELLAAAKGLLDWLADIGIYQTPMGDLHEAVAKVERARNPAAPLAASKVKR